MKFKFTTKVLIIGVITVLVFVIAPVPNLAITGLDSVFNAVTFIFGVLYGFEISIVLSNFTSLKTALAQMNAELRAIYVSLKAINSAAAEFAAGRLEKFLMKSIDTELIDHYKTDREFTDVIEMGNAKELADATMQDADAQGVRVQFVYQAFYDVSNTRNQVKQVAPKFIETPEWLMLFALASIMIVILFLERVDVTTSITSGILTTTILGSLIILNDIDANDLQEGFLEYEVFNTTLVDIGKRNYYPDFAITGGAVKIPSGKPYRVGHFPHYPDMEGRTVETVNS